MIISKTVPDVHEMQFLVIFIVTILIRCQGQEPLYCMRNGVIVLLNILDTQEYRSICCGEFKFILHTMQNGEYLILAGFFLLHFTYLYPINVISR